MEKKDIFQDIQNIRSSNPVIVLGSGASVSYGIPGMGVLANELKNFFKSNPYYDTATNDVVSDFIKLLDSGVGLEAALLDVKVPEIVEADIVNIVWKVIIESDAKVYERFISGEDINLRQLFDYIIYGDPNKTLNVISTNYDRIAEYAACQTDAYINIGFTHGLMGKLKDNIMLNPKKPEADYTGFINILKVHGSLDWYRSLPHHKHMAEHPSAQASIERPTDTTSPYVERGRAFAKKQAERKQQVKKQAKVNRGNLIRKKEPYGFSPQGGARLLQNPNKN